MVSELSMTCVIPAFNREGTVARAIESALAQTRAPAEVIVVDDGSTDGTRRVAEAFGGVVRCITQVNAGGAAARNAGARAAESDWIAFLDSDDHWTPQHLENVAAAIEATDGQAHFYFADLRRTQGEGGHRQWEQARFEIDGSYALLQDATPWVVRPRIPMMLQGTVFRREPFLAKGALWAEMPRRHDTHGFLVHGIGSPACAVAGVGCLMTADDSSGTRLTAQMDARSRLYWNYSAMIWRDVLRRFPRLTGPGRKLLQHRLVVAELHLARHDLGHANPRGLAHLLRAALAGPGLFAASLVGRRPREEQVMPYGPEHGSDRAD
jgi:glycosyltransferase involved in cell wall biosynthesis